jgi:hypothetical protein
MNGLTEFQTEVTRLFFSLPASDGFLLAGGGALLGGLSSRLPLLNAVGNPYAFKILSRLFDFRFTVRLNY